jgi:hypothetical protein
MKCFNCYSEFYPTAAQIVDFATTVENLVAFTVKEEKLRNI